MALLVGIALALFVFDSPWSYVVVAAGGAIEIAEAGLWWRWTHRRRPAVGVETLIGQTIAVERGWTFVAGERWQVRGVDDGPAQVVAVDGLALVAERLPS